MQQIALSIAQALNHLPRPHRIILGSLTIATLAVVAWRPYIYSSMVVQPVHRIIPLEDRPLRQLASESKTPLNKSSLDIKNNIPKNEKLGREVGLHEYLVSSDDTLRSIFTRYGINITETTALLQQYPALRHLKIGQSLSWSLTTTGRVQCLIWKIPHCETHTYDRTTEGFKERVTTMSSEWRNTTLIGQLNGSFVTSARIAGLNGSDVNAVIKALQWQLDFRKLHKGDQFSVLILRKMLDSKSTQSQLLGVRLHTGGKDYYAFRANDGKFYNRDATSIARGFMRVPIMKQFRISSNFNPRRLNPVTGRISPHCGVDFAVPVGTPVLAVGDGEVVVSKNGGAAGNYVTIRHDRQYMTRYMHLKKLLVKPGQRVKRGDRIALSGNTGRSTGPHLHFEVWINQQAVNPLTAKFLSTERLTGRERLEYLGQVKKMLPQLGFN